MGRSVPLTLLLLPCPVLFFLWLVVWCLLPPWLVGGVVGACSTGYAIRNRYNFLTKRSLEEAQRHLRAFPQVGRRGAAIAEHRPTVIHQLMSRKRMDFSCSRHHTAP